MRNPDKAKKEFEKSLFKLLSKKNYHDLVQITRRGLARLNYIKMINLIFRALKIRKI